ncbi:hypothetical protein BLA29_015220 [Euroglyphus maynei]|uniref:Uncharacterized protein n=1 Tax=Euroglyphus maynei TaxID=6958 RepID=A0A1Y3BUJ7_EURMA|nr:hypothetical protein BLA29_015220 [Euroglyphus maynei]
MPFGQYIPYHYFCKRYGWMKPNLIVPLYRRYPKMREFFDFIDVEPKPWDLWHTFANTRLTTPWNRQTEKAITPIPDMRDRK